MKKVSYRFGDHKCHAYMKEAGNGYEVGFYFGNQCVFVGNFIHRAEATKWWAKMNQEFGFFTKRYGVGEPASMTWYAKFWSHHVYKCYYGYLDQEFAKYQRSFDKACRNDLKKYSSYKKNRHYGESFTLRKAA